MRIKLLLLDYNNLYFRGLHALPEFNYGPIYTTGLYGFLTQVSKHINDFEPDYLLLCNDDPPYLRKDIFPEYKSIRKRDRDEKLTKIIYEGRVLCEEFISMTGLPTWKEPGFEADDLIARICQSYSSLKVKTRIISNDSDLYQLFRYPNIEINLSKKIYTRADFSLDYPYLSASDWPKFIAIVGSHNDVPGIKGIGPAGAKKVLSNKSKWEKLYQDNKDLIDRNIKLSTLPIKDNGLIPPSFTYMQGFSHYNEREVTLYLSKHGINITKNMVKAFNLLKRMRNNG